MREFCAWLEHLEFSQWVQSSPSIWAYPTILFLHSVGMVLVAGISAAVDIRLLGVAREIPVRALERLYPVIWLGFLISASTGLILTIIDATTKFYNPDFWLKMIFVFSAVWIVYAIRKSVFAPDRSRDDVVSSSAKRMAWVSLFCWFAAITAGRLLAYVGPVSGGFGANNR